MNLQSLRTLNHLQIGDTYNQHLHTPEPLALARCDLILNQPHLFPKNPKDAIFGERPVRNKKFAGREQALAVIKTTLESSGCSMIAEEQSIDVDDDVQNAAQGIFGFGGVGKTQLVARYVETLPSGKKQRSFTLNVIAVD